MITLLGMNPDTKPNSEGSYWIYRATDFLEDRFPTLTAALMVAAGLLVGLVSFGYLVWIGFGLLRQLL